MKMKIKSIEIEPKLKEMDLYSENTWLKKKIPNQICFFVLDKFMKNPEKKSN